MIDFEPITKSPFKDTIMARTCMGCVKAFRTEHRDLFINGKRRHSPHYGSSVAQWFWNGFDAVALKPGSKKMVGYACYRAGVDCRKRCVAWYADQMKLVAQLEKVMPT